MGFSTIYWEGERSSKLADTAHKSDSLIKDCRLPQVKNLIECSDFTPETKQDEMGLCGKSYIKIVFGRIPPLSKSCYYKLTKQIL